MVCSIAGWELAQLFTSCNDKIPSNMDCVWLKQLLLSFPYASRDVTTLRKYYGYILLYCMDTAKIVFTVLYLRTTGCVQYDCTSRSTACWTRCKCARTYSITGPVRISDQDGLISGTIEMSARSKSPRPTWPKTLSLNPQYLVKCSFRGWRMFYSSTKTEL